LRLDVRTSTEASTPTELDALPPYIGRPHDEELARVRSTTTASGDPPDAGVEVAGAWAGHHRHTTAAAWFDRQDRALLLCRTTHTSLIRLLTIPTLMGPDVLIRRAAWQGLKRVLDIDRTRWSNSGAGFRAGRC